MKASPVARADKPSTEEQFYQQIRSLAAVYGYLCYHTRFSLGSTAGFPDVVLASVERGRVLALELKVKPTSAPTQAQAQWLVALSAGGVPAYCVRPGDIEFVRRLLAGEVD